MKTSGTEGMSVAIAPPAEPKRAAEPENLFIQFARLASDAQPIQAFAEKYGSLDGSTEPLGKWVAEIEAVNMAIRLWLDLERARGRKIDEGVTSAFPPPPDHVLGERVSDVGEMIADLFSETGWSVDVAGRFGMLHELARKGVERRATVRLQAEYSNLTFTAVPIGETLAGRVWLQLSRAVSERWVLRACQQCGTPFRLTDPRGMYCSPACKVAASRARRQK